MPRGGNNISDRDLSTGSYRKKRVNAAKLTEAGETFIPKELLTKVSEKFGKDFYVLAGEQEDGRPIEIVFSGQYLHRMLKDNWDDLVDRLINLSGSGAGFEREYHIKMAG